MKKLGNRNYKLIKSGVQAHGTYDPDEIMYFFEEELYVDEYDEVYDFLEWVHENDKPFGGGNYEEVFFEFKKSNLK